MTNPLHNYARKMATKYSARAIYHSHSIRPVQDGQSKRRRKHAWAESLHWFWLFVYHLTAK